MLVCRSSLPSSFLIKVAFFFINSSGRVSNYYRERISHTPNLIVITHKLLTSVHSIPAYTPNPIKPEKFAKS